MSSKQTIFCFLVSLFTLLFAKLVLALDPNNWSLFWVGGSLLVITLSSYFLKPSHSLKQMNTQLLSGKVIPTENSISASGS